MHMHCTHWELLLPLNIFFVRSNPFQQNHRERENSVKEVKLLTKISLDCICILSPSVESFCFCFCFNFEVYFSFIHQILPINLLAYDLLTLQANFFKDYPHCLIVDSYFIPLKTGCRPFYSLVTS